MKRRIAIALGVCCLLFLIGGIYIALTIERSITTVNNLIRLHRVELMREQFLIQLKRTQSDLYLKNTRYARNMDTVVTHVESVDAAVTGCFGCHHSEQVTKRLEGLKFRIEEYKEGLSRVFTIRANRGRLEAEEDNTFRIGAELIDDLNTITTVAHQKLEERTQNAFRDIARTKTIFYLLLAAVPLAALGLSILFVRAFTHPVDVLLTATRRLKGGDLSYRVSGLRDEYGEVASSFNEMASSLKFTTTKCSGRSKPLC
jgi:methyl-accepting chemotaxis protein